MRDLSAIAASLTGATSLCRCWRLTRRDGVSFGFTDHDRDISFDGTTFAAGTGLDAAEATSELGFATAGGDVAGALAAAGLTEADIQAGLYDGAAVEVHLVDWAHPERRLLTDVATIGEVKRQDGAFVAELRGAMHRLDEERGRTYRAGCAADLGDARCRVDLDAFTVAATITTTDGAISLRADALAAFAPGWFAGGRIIAESGAAAGLSLAVKIHDSGGVLTLWERAARPLAPGDAVRAVAGCDKSLATCRDRFANAVNFRGFPHMPGNDFVVRVAGGGEPGFDGGSLFQ